MSKAVQGKRWRRAWVTTAAMAVTLLGASNALTAPITPYLEARAAIGIVQLANNGNGNGNGGPEYSKKSLRPRYAAPGGKGHKPHTSNNFSSAAYLPPHGSVMMAPAAETPSTWQSILAVVSPTATAAATISAPSPADLSETIDVTFSPAIRTLANSLGNNPVKIYNWVRDNVTYTPTHGSIQGADATLQTLHGNDFDTASLLIALLRAANIPARYVYGTIEVPAAAAQNWVGGVAAPEAAVTLFDQAGVPVQGVFSGGAITSVQVEHVWVEAFVDFNPSRGAVNRNASTWVPLDASYKQYLYTAGMPVRSKVPVDTATLATQLTSGATVSTDSVSGLNTSTLSTTYTSFTSQVSAYIAATKPNATVSDVLGSQSTVAEDLPLLAGSLPYKVVATGAIYSALPDNLRWQVKYGLYASEFDRTQGNAIVSTTQWLPQLVGKRLTLSFNGAASSDASKLAGVLNASPLPTSINGASLIQTSAQLTLDGQVVSSGGSVAFGTTLVGGLGLFEPQAGVWTYTPSARVVAGETHTLAAVGQGVSPAMLSASRDRLAAMSTQMSAGQYSALTQDAFVGEVLNNAALSYITTVAGNSDLMCKACGVISYALPTIARVNTHAAPSYSNGIPQAVTFPGVAMTIEEIGRTAVATDNNAAKALAFQRSYGERASAYTHLLLDAVFTDATHTGKAASTVRALDTASAAHQAIDFLTSSNAATLIPQLSVDPATVTVLKDAIGAGRTATISQGSVTINNWSGVGYALEDPGIGSGDYEVTGRDEAQLVVTGGWLPLALAGSAFSVQGSAVATAVGGVLKAEANYYPAAVALLANYGTIPWANFVAAPLVVSQWWLCDLGEGLSGTLNTGTVGLVSLINVDQTTNLPGAPQTNSPPYFTSKPVLSGAAGQPYQYFATAIDPNGTALTFTLTAAPPGMAIAANGLVTWSNPLTGSYPITVHVSDGQGSADQSYTLTVGQVMPLALNLGISPQFVNVGGTVTISVATTGGSGAITKALTVDGAAVALDANGQATITAQAPGAHQVVATATDYKGTLTQSGAFGVAVAGVTTPPTLAIAAPADGATLTAPTAVTGTVNDANLVKWQLLISPSGQAQWTLLASGSQNVSNGALGTLDPTQLTNGQYDLALFATNANGLQSSQVITVLVYGDLKLGLFTVSFNDIQLDVGGVPLTVVRTYDSRKKDIKGDFGYGWALGYQNVNLQRNRPLGESWELYQKSLLTLCIRPIGKRVVSIALADGKLHQFDVVANPDCGTGQVPAVFSMAFNPRPGTTSTLDSLDAASLLYQGGTVYDSSTAAAFDSVQYKLTTLENYQYILTSSDGAKTFQVAQITDPNGQTLVLNQQGMFSSNGTALQFQRDAQGRITQVSDPAGRTVKYAYTAAGDLDNITSPLGQVSRNQYATVPASLAHLLTNYTDPAGVQQLRNEYDATGRLIAQYDALGKKVDFSQRSLDTHTQVVTDRNGSTTTYTFDDQGNITKVVDPLGGTTASTFDAYGNELSKTDPLGHTTSTTYDTLSGTVLKQTDALGNSTTSTWNFYTMMGNHTPQNLQSTTDALGHTTSYGYTSPGMLAAISDPLGNSTRLGWGGTNFDQLTQLTDPTGHITSYQNDSQGRKIAETDPLGNITKYTYDAAGHLLTTSKTRTIAGQLPQTLTTTNTVDADGNVLSTTDALGNVTQSTWNAQKKLTAQTDALGRVTTYGYDAATRPIKTTYPDGTSESTAYDANGNATQQTDRAGRTASTAYDALNRPTALTNADGTTTSTTYDAAGQVTRTTDELSRMTGFQYDAAGRKTQSTDSAGNATSYAYDATGKLTQVTDALSHVTKYDYDAANRKTQTTFADGNVSKYTYDAAGRKTQDTDALNRTTQYGYDANGRLNQVTDALGKITRYGYDELGNKTQQTDALSHVTTWGYDGLGRVTSHSLPDNRYETFAYDTVGRLTNRTDYAGNATGLQYDVADRLKQQTLVDGTVLGTTYTASGQIATQTQSLNGVSLTTKYSYDQRDRLTDIQNPDASKLHYVYDAAGQRTSVTLTTPDQQSQTISYTYDAAGNLAAVATNGKTFTYKYDAANRKIERDDPNGNVTKYSYDVNGRLTGWTTSKGATAMAPVLSQGTYTLNAAGQRTALKYQAPDGQTRTLAYSYDGAGKLIGETRDLPAHSTSWTLDAFGNRTGQTLDGQSSSYSYDTTDRLTGITGAAAATYTWDTNGQLQTKTVGSGVSAQKTTYSFDARHELIGVVLQDGTKIEYRYQPDGNISQRIKTLPGGTPQVTNYLVDPNLAFAQVAAEYDSNGHASSIYVYGDELLLRNKSGQTSTYQHDGLGSVTSLTDDTGSATQTYGYDAWGNAVESTGTDNNPYRYAGERVDADTGLIYLRARWYEPQTGRFVSQDPAQGQPKLPITQNKYAYANGDPIDSVDPLGLMTLGDVGASIDIQGILTNIAKDQVSSYVQSQIFGSDNEPLNGPSTLYDTMVGLLMKAIAGSVSDPSTVVAAAAAAAGASAGGPRHHTIPEYMCGASEQELVVLTKDQHTKLHNELYAFNTAVSIGSKVYDLIFRRKLRLESKSPIQIIAHNADGRLAIAAGLGIFYEDFGYNGTPWAYLGAGTKTGLPLGEVLLKEGFRFAVLNHHSYPTCKKK